VTAYQNYLLYESLMLKLSQFAKNLQDLKFNTVFETKGVSQIYDSHFDSCHVTV